MINEDYYSFLSSEDEEGSTYYEFITKHHYVYELYFKVDEYTKYVKDYPLLLQEGYAFGFRRKKPNDHRKNAKDPLVFSTIYKIILDFFKEKGNSVVLLYHCDANDGKHHSRNKLFNGWDEVVKVNNAYTKNSLEVEVPDREHNKIIRKVYLGYILSKENPNYEKVEKEFEQFSVDLILPKDEI